MGESNPEDRRVRELLSHTAKAITVADSDSFAATRVVGRLAAAVERRHAASLTLGAASRGGILGLLGGRAARIGRLGAGGARASWSAAARDLEMPTLLLEYEAPGWSLDRARDETGQGAEGLPALVAALRQAEATCEGESGARRFSPVVFDRALRLATCREDETRPLRTPLRAEVVTGFGGGELPVVTSAQRFASDRRTGELVTPEPEGVAEAPPRQPRERPLGFVRVTAPSDSVISSRGAAVAEPLSGPSPSERPARAGRYGYSHDLSVMPAELFSVSLAERSWSGPEGRYGRALEGRPDTPTISDPVVFVNLTESAEPGWEPTRGSGLRAPVYPAGRRALPAALEARMKAGVVSVSEAARLKQVAGTIEASPVAFEPGRVPRDSGDLDWAASSESAEERFARFGLTVPGGHDELGLVGKPPGLALPGGESVLLRLAGTGRDAERVAAPSPSLPKRSGSVLGARGLRVPARGGAFSVARAIPRLIDPGAPAPERGARRSA